MIKEIEAKSVLNKHKRRDPWFLDDYSVNPYGGCSFNCIYCYTRGGRYGNSPGEVGVKVNAPEVLERQLARRARKGEYGIIALGTATEPYMRGVEDTYRITRSILEVIKEYRFPVHILTKSPLVARDADIISEIAAVAIMPGDLSGMGSGAFVTLSFSTMDNNLARLVEPGAPSPGERLDTMRLLSKEGIRVGAALIPLLPFISDGEDELDEMISIVAKNGARYVFAGALTLPEGAKEAYHNFLHAHYPELVEKYACLYARGFQPPWEYQKRMEEKARALCRRYGVRYGLM